MARILILEDSEIDCKLYTKTLGAKHVLEFHDTSANFVENCNRFKPNLILLDVTLKDSSGFSAMKDLCRCTHSDTPVFFVSGSLENDQKIRALQLGAQDYLTKPILPSELLLKIENTLKRASDAGPPNSHMHSCGPLHLNTSSSTLEIVHATHASVQPISLTSQESRMLQLFFEKPNHVFSREEILHRIWGNNVHVVDRVVDTLVSTLRKKCRPFGKHFESVYGVGYRFVSF